EAALVPAGTDIDDWENIEWKEILPKSPLDPGSQNFYECQSGEIFSHLRLHIYPDGGVARLKVYGEVFKDWNNIDKNMEIDLAAAINGAKAIQCNDMFFSSMNNLLMPGRGVNMGDGWETKRNRTPGNRDWVIIKLAHPGTIERVLVDTHHFKGNYPDSCSIEGRFSESNESLTNGATDWEVILPQQKLQANKEHVFITKPISDSSFSHVRLNIFPDGGISRLRLFGKIKDQ
ncbi:MAG: alc, partial [Flaviaesturariibacter sp.]|nr:alc [Flaviaesturariibacter sp.]